MQILLDTHLLLWALSTPRKLSTKARPLIEKSDVYVSAASIWEISIKAALGKLAVRPKDVLAGVEPAGFTLLPVTGNTLHTSSIYQCITGIRSIDFSSRKHKRNRCDCYRMTQSFIPTATS